MFNTDLDAIVPMLCVTLAALASMVWLLSRNRTPVSQPAGA